MIYLAAERVGALAVFLVDIPNVGKMPGTHDRYAAFFEMPLSLIGHFRRVRRAISNATNAQRGESRHHTAKSSDEPGVADRLHFFDECRFSSLAEGITR